MATFSNQNHSNYEIVDPIEVQNYYQCAHCDTFFIPKKRFVQKYCSESCRVMACRARKAGKSEKPASPLGRKTNTTHRTPASNDTKQTPEQNNTHLLEELKSYLDDRDAKLLKKVEKIQEQQKFHMWISALAPLVAEPVRKSLGRLFQGNKTPQDVNHFLAQVAPKIKELPEELQVMVLNSAKEYWDASGDGNYAGQKKGVVGLSDLKGAL